MGPMQNVCHEVGQAQQPVCSPPERVSLERVFGPPVTRCSFAEKGEVASNGLDPPGLSIWLVSKRVGVKECSGDSRRRSSLLREIFNPNRAVLFTGSATVQRLVCR